MRMDFERILERQKATWRERNCPVAVPYFEEILAEALLTKGIIENPLYSNDGPELRAYMSPVGFAPGLNWCLFYVRAVRYHAYAKLGLRDTYDVPTGQCHVYLGQAEHRGFRSIYFATGAPYFLLDHNGNPFHCGIAESINPDDKSCFFGWEGNTNDDGSDHGIKVMRKERPFGRIAFVGW